MKAIRALKSTLEPIFQPLLWLGIRLYMANVFFSSGWLKFQNYLNDMWEGTVDLFAYEHPLILRPEVANWLGIERFELLSPEISAIMGTAGELVFSALLAFGLFGRFAALGLIGMTAVIQLTYQDLEIHYVWAMLLAVIAALYPSRFASRMLPAHALRSEV